MKILLDECVTKYLKPHLPFTHVLQLKKYGNLRLFNKDNLLNDFPLVLILLSCMLYAASSVNKVSVVPFKCAYTFGKLW